MVERANMEENVNFWRVKDENEDRLSITTGHAYKFVCDVYKSLSSISFKFFRKSAIQVRIGKHTVDE